MVGEARRSPRKHKSCDWRRSESRSRYRKILNENEKVDRDRSRRRNREKPEKKIGKYTDGKNNFDTRRKISDNRDCNRSMRNPRKERTSSPHERPRDSSVERLFRTGVCTFHLMSAYEIHNFLFRKNLRSRIK